LSINQTRDGALNEKIWFIPFAGVCALAFLGYQYFGQECTSCEPAKMAQVKTQGANVKGGNVKSANVESSQQLAVPASPRTLHSKKGLQSDWVTNEVEI
jgi:hypothetical protein